MEKDTIFTFWIRYSKGDLSFHIGFFWIVLVAALVWWVF